MRDGEVGAPEVGARSALMVATIGVLLLSTMVLGSLLGWWPAGVTLDDLPVQITMVLFLALGPLVLWKADGNRVGWVLSGIGLMLTASGIVTGLAERGVLVFQAIGGGLWLGWILLIGMLVLWFPTGRVPSRRWLWLQWTGFALLAVLILTYTFTEQVCVRPPDSESCVWAANPIGITGMPDPEYGWLSGPVGILLLVFMAGSTLSLFLRYRKAKTVERLQLKWFLLAGASFALSLATELVFGALGVDEAPLLVDIWISLSIIGIPVATTLAILRYRLYDIDRIISRTVSYAIVIGLLALIYVAGLAGLTSLLDTESPLIVAGSTLAVAALFNPLRRRVQSGVDHRFNRTRYDAERVMTGFTGSLRDEVDPDRVVGGWVSVVEETMNPSSAGVWVRSGT